MLRIAGREIRQHPARLLAAGLAVVISVGFMVACLTFVATETHSISRRLTADTSTSDVVVQLSQDPGGRLQRRIAAAPGVAAVAATYTGSVDFSSGRAAGELELNSLPPAAFRWSTLHTGRWPRRSDEVAVGAAAAKSYALAVGSTIQVSTGSNGQRPLEVVGVVDESRSLLGGLQSSAVVADDYFTGSASPTLLVRATPGTDPNALAVRLRPLVGPDDTVDTSAVLARQAVESVTDDAQTFRYLLLVFAGIALLVGAMIIVNTFSIIVAQRRRQLGLLRAVGASTTQVRRQLVAEAGIVGVLGSAAGVGLGLGITAVAVVITGSAADGLVVPPGQVVAAYAAGVVLTGLAALVPAHRATRVAPLEALRPVADATTGRRATRWRALVSGAAVLLGAGVIAYALHRQGHNVAFTVLGSMLASVGVLAGAPVFLPPALRAAGVLVSRSGVTSRLAAANLVRNPARAAATGTALMLAVGLIVTLQVGAASLKATTNDTVDQQFPVDVTVTNPGGPLAAGILPAVAAVPGIKAITPVRMTRAQIKDPGAGVDEIDVAGLGADAAPVVSAGFGALTDRVALAHHFTLEMLGRHSGDPITLVEHGHRATFTLQASDIADAGMVVVTDDALAALDPQAPVESVWAAAADRDQAAAVVAGVRQAMATQPGLVLAGSLDQAAATSTLLDTLLQVATGLLAVAVAIALVGVGNSLGLSVLERTRESALLRALGLQRRQLRLMLAVEAVLLAGVAAVVGIVAGVTFGAVGTAALAAETTLGDLRLAVSVPQTLAVVAVTVVAAALASVLPGRRAAQAAPTAALAET